MHENKVKQQVVDFKHEMSVSWCSGHLRNNQKWRNGTGSRKDFTTGTMKRKTGFYKYLISN